MSNSLLPTKIFELSGYQEKYNVLLNKSVIEQFPIIPIHTNEDIDISYLLMCASIFSESNNIEHLDAAFRTAQYVIQDSTSSQNQRNSAAYILDKMTNHSAIQLAINRKQLSKSYLEDIPVQFNLDSINRLMMYSFFDNKTDKIIPINKFQYNVMTEVDRNDWISISAPTSAGKSFILLHVIQKFLEDNSSGVIIYLVPTRSLVQQVEMDIREKLVEQQILDVFVSSVPLLDVFSQSYNKQVFVLTQERLQWLLTATRSLAPNLLIIDEAQKIGDGARGILLQQVIEEVGRRSPKGKVIFSSPMTSNPGILLEQANSLLRKETVEKESVTVNQNLIWVNQIFKKPKDWTMSICIRNEIRELGSIKLSRKPITKLDRLAFMSYTLADKNGGNLIYANTPSEAEKCAKILWDLQEIDKETPNSEIEELIKLVKETINPEYNLIHFLKRRIGYHYGNMPLIIKNEVERLFSDGTLQFLVCTSTLIEGMNLPAKSIFVRGPQKGRGIPMNEMDFWNLAGRAGRQGKEFQGNVICIDTQDETIWNYSPPTKKKKYKIQKSMDKILINNPDILLNYINDGTPREISKKNPELEYAFSFLITEHIRNNGLKNSSSMSQHTPITIENLEASIVEVLNRVEIPEHILIKHPGISPIAQQNLLNFFIENAADIDNYKPLHPNNRDALQRYMNIIDKIQDTLTGEHPGKNFHYSLLVLEWMKGYPVARIIDRNWNFWKDKNKKKIQAIIRETLTDIEEFARFKFVKYFSCYKDILYFYLNSENIEVEIELNDITVWLELGASQKTQISLMGLGFNRTTAIYLANFLNDTDLERSECIELLKNISWDNLSLSSVTRREIKQILRLYIG